MSNKSDHTHRSHQDAPGGDESAPRNRNGGLNDVRFDTLNYEESRHPYPGACAAPPPRPPQSPSPDSVQAPDR